MTHYASVSGNRRDSYSRIKIGRTDLLHLASGSRTRTNDKTLGAGKEL